MSCLNENGCSKETKLAAPWVEREVYAKLPRLSPGKARRSNRFLELNENREKGLRAGVGLVSWGEVCEQRLRV